MNGRLLLLTIIILVQFSCKTELDIGSIKHPKEIREEIVLFLSYAPENFKIKPIEIVLTANLHNRKGVQVSGLYIHRKRKVYLDTTSYYYRNMRIALIMHELGHAILDRDEVTVVREKDDPWYPYTKSFMNLKSATPRDILLIEEQELLENLMNELFI
jgi:hypothetical protein